jgi:steroid delta-isomerase-like uncharacterized protein
MSGNAEDVVKQYVAAWNDSNWDRVEEVVAPEFLNHNPSPLPGARADRDGLLTAMRYVRQTLPDGRARPVNVVAHEDKVVFHGVIEGTDEGKDPGVTASGQRFSFEFIFIFRVAHGRIVERWGFADSMGLRRLGALPTAEQHAA